MENRPIIFGIKRNYLRNLQQLVLLAMLHSTLVAPSQNMLIDYFNYNEPLVYLGSRLNTIIQNNATNVLQQNLPKHDRVNLDSNLETPNKKKNLIKDKEIGFSLEADINEGTIGVSATNPLDDASDNLFKFIIADLPTNLKVYLSYDLSGVHDFTSVSRSINDRPATGGHIIKNENHWSTQKEEINLNWLHLGENKIMFSSPIESNLSYKVKNVKLTFENTNNSELTTSLVLLTKNISLIKDNKLYVKGFVRTSNKDIKILADGKQIPMHNDEFDGFVTLTDMMKINKFIMISASDSNGFLGQELVTLDNLQEADKIVLPEIQPEENSTFVKAKTKIILTTDGASLAINENALENDKEIKITKLRKVDIAPLSSGLINVTKGGTAYRFLPDGTAFQQPVRLAIAYDENLLPKGHKPEEIKTFYFNTNSKTWTAIERDTINKVDKTVESFTTHFTDYINGVIQTPESPETAGFTPTMMNDLKAADPSAEMTLISPPEVSQKGDANVSYPIKIPAGRKGMQPSLAVQYSSDGGNGWLGEGWNLSTPAISLDTRWGSPIFDQSRESEMYLMDGEQLMYPQISNLSNVLVDWMPNRHYDASTTNPIPITEERARITNAIFTPRKQGSFSKIERLGTNPTNYYWKVTASNGTINWYGSNPALGDDSAIIKNDDGNIVHWALCMTEDVFGNNIIYRYENYNLLSTQSSGNSNLLGGRVFNISRIIYTGNATSQGNYKVSFYSETNQIIRKDLHINYKLGLKQINPYRLKIISVENVTEQIRKYELLYITGVFDKSLLSKITEYDGSNKEFYSHQFEYHQDLEYKGSEPILYKQPYTVGIPSITPDFTVGLTNLFSSRISSSESLETQWGVTPAAGIDIFWPSNNPARLFTIGAPFGESNTKGKGQITLADMNGDGLDDILFKTSSGLKYLRHYKDVNGIDQFSSIANSINNINNFQKTNGWTKTMFGESWNIDVAWRFFAGTNRFKSSEDTEIYMTDGNADGLPDIVANVGGTSRVLFNTLSADGTVNYSANSNTTPNMLIAGNATALSEVPDANLENITNDYDVVRVWEAPVDMKIKITDNFSYTTTSSQTIKYSIETTKAGLGRFRIYHKEFAPNSNQNIVLTSYGSSPTYPLGTALVAGVASTMDVTQGQKIYFRLHKNKTGTNDILYTNPIIWDVNASIATAVLDQNGLDIQKYNYSNDFVLSSNDDALIPETGNGIISWETFNVLNLSDNIRIKIQKIVTSNASSQPLVSSVFDQLYSTMGANNFTIPSGSINYNITGPISNGTTIEFRFSIETLTNIDWKKIVWKPKLTFAPSNITSTNSSFTKYPVPKCSIYQIADKTVLANDFVLTDKTSYCNPGINWFLLQSSNYKVIPNTYLPVGSTLINGNFLFVVKKDGVIIGIRTISVTNNSINLDNPYPIEFYSGTVDLNNPPKITCEFYADGSNNLSAFRSYTAATSINCLGNVIIANGTEWNSASSTPIYSLNDVARFHRFTTGVYQNTKEHLGTMHRGWGQFLYNSCANKKKNDPICNQIDLLVDDNIVESAPLIANSVVSSTLANNILNNCQNAVDQNACATLQVENYIASLNLPAEGGTVNSDNIAGLIANLQSNQNSGITPTFPLVTMKVYRKLNINDNTLIEKWIGVTDAQYSTPNRMRNSSINGSDMDSVFTNPTVDIVPIISGTQDTGMFALTKNHRSVSRSYTLGWGNLNYSTSTSSYSVDTTDFLDMNGDGYPDHFSTGQIKYSKMTGAHNAPKNHAWLDPNFSINTNEATVVKRSFTNSGRKPVASPSDQRHSITFSTKISNQNIVSGGCDPSSSPQISVTTAPPTSGNDNKTNESDSGVPSNNIGLGLNINLSGSNKERDYWIDLNGDGLPDKVNNINTVQFNNGKSINSNGYQPFSFLNSNETKPSRIQPSVSLSSSIATGNFGFSLSAGISGSTGKSNVSLQDLNGDGLVDLLEVDNSNPISPQARVRFNNGNGFSASQVTLQNYGTKILNQSTSGSLSGSVSYFSGTPICCFWPFPPIFLPIIYLKYGGTASGSVNLTVSESNKVFKDFDGDGFTDYVETNGTNIKVYPSNIRRTNKLKIVKGPIGGSFVIDYALQPVTFNNPHPKWAMSRLTVITDSDGTDKISDDIDIYNKTFVYENGTYDRRERDFYEYEVIKTQDMFKGNNGVYRTLVSKYHVNNYFLEGLLKESYVIKGTNDNLKFSRTENFYEILKLSNVATIGNNEIVIPKVVYNENFDKGGSEGRRSATTVLSKTKNYLYELEATPQITSESLMTYDKKGRVVTYQNLGNTAITGDEYTTQILYHATPTFIAKNILNVPSSLVVETLRKRTTTVDNFGAITAITAEILSSPITNAVTTLEYYTNGNLKNITYPACSTDIAHGNGTSMSYTYTYDTTLQKYITNITDAFGNSSQATYNPSFDKLLTTTDYAGNLMTYEYDTFGRTKKIIAPKEATNTNPYTLKFDYYPFIENLPVNNGVTAATFVPVAVTSHYDFQNPTNSIDTYTFVDGLGRVQQTKKDISINTGTPQVPIYIEYFSISSRQNFDDFGRINKQFNPSKELKSSTTNFLFNQTALSYFYPTLTTHDEMDRPLSILNGEGSITSFEYSTALNWNNIKSIKTKTTIDQNATTQVVSETFKDVFGRLTTTNNIGTPNLLTKYNYNSIGELTSYMDAGNITTSYLYDKLGRKTKFTNPNSGVTSYFYDNASNLIKVQTPVMLADATISIAANKFIKYKYDKNRLLSITYPVTTTTPVNLSNVSYTYGTSGNNKSRVITQTDATGAQNFSYGTMGEIVSTTRKVIGPNIPTRSFTTSFVYDSWNRLSSMVYPDAENITFNYDFGGNLNKMSGVIDGSPYDYIKQIDYDNYEQRTYIKYGNNTETLYTYTPAMRRMNNLNVKTSTQQNLFNNSYLYDKIGNVISLTNNAIAVSNKMGGSFSNTYNYDNQNRLSSASGDFTGNIAQQAQGNDYSASYLLTMDYTSTHGIAKKFQSHTKNGISYPVNTYDNTYSYFAGTHKLQKITTSGSTILENFTYDANGNIKTKIKGPNSRNFYWDESNRLRVEADAGTMQHYIYDASGERVLKANTSTQAIYTNGSLITPSTTTINGYTTYPSGFIVVDPFGNYSKHYYAGSQRIISRVGGSASIFLCPTCRPSDAGIIEDSKLQQAQKDNLNNILDKENLGKATFDEFKPYSYEEVSKVLLEDEREQEQETNSNRAPYPPPTLLEPIYFYHPDHLGSSTFLTDRNGKAYQFFLNLPFGETMAEQLPSTYYKSPYKFNGKELDEETGLYYYGARYYDPRSSIWLSTDPLAEMYPSVGGYVYCINNPIIHTDPTGRSVDGEFEKDKNGKWQKTSTVGDDIGVDFYHTDGKDKDGNATQNTYVTDRKGNWNSIKNGREALSGEKRGNDVNWENIYDEWSGGYGPERSVFEGDHPANKAIKGNYLFGHAYTDFKDSGLTKSGGAVDFGLLDVMMTDNNMQVQMMGSYNASFYKLGETTLSLIQDSKSRSSFYLHLPLENYPRGQMEYNFHTKGFVPNDKETNTFQTYLFLAKYPKK